MKKHLIAAAVAAAVAAPAMAQNVSLYGTLDAGIHTLSSVGAQRNDATVFYDSVVSSSVWGIRGSEDLGGGLRAVFDAQSDINLNNGGIASQGLFRRAAYVGVAGGMGEVTLGLRMNPLIATNAGMMPLGGNLVQSNLAAALTYNDFFTRNAVTYTSPNLGGLVLQGQYGFANSITTNTQGGDVIAGSAVYNMGGFTFRAAMQDRKANGVTSSANAGPAAGTFNPSVVAGAEKTYLAGITYVTGPWAAAVAMYNNRGNLQGAAAAREERSARQMGIAYQLNPALRIGGSYTRAEGSTLSNLQGRYTLSKRTSIYAYYGMADNQNNAAGGGATVSFVPMAGQTNAIPNAAVDSYAAAAGARSSAFGAGMIHTF